MRIFVLGIFVLEIFVFAATQNGAEPFFEKLRAVCLIFYLQENS